MRMYLCSIVLWVQCTFQSSHSVCVCENIMLSALLKMWPYRWHPIYCAKNISNILAICFLMILVSVDLFYAIRYLLCYSWIIKTSPWAGPCSPQKSRVPSASRASCFSWPNWPLWPYQLNILPSWPLANQTAPEAPLALATVMLLPFLCGAAWSSMVDLVGMSHHRGYEGSLHHRSGRDVGVGRLGSQGVLHQVHPWNISGYDREPQISCLGQYRQLGLLGQSFHSR